MSVYYRGVGEAADWQEIGHTLLTDITFGSEPEFETCATCGARCWWQDCPTGGWWVHENHPSDDHDAEPRDLYPYFRQRWLTGMDQTLSMEFEIREISVEALELIYGLPFHPVRRRGLTGKAYRQACRRYQRRLKAFRLGEVDWRGVR